MDVNETTSFETEAEIQTTTLETETRSFETETIKIDLKTETGLETLTSGLL